MKSFDQVREGQQELIDQFFSSTFNGELNDYLDNAQAARTDHDTYNIDTVTVRVGHTTTVDSKSHYSRFCVYLKTDEIKALSIFYDQPLQPTRDHFCYD